MTSGLPHGVFDSVRFALDLLSHRDRRRYWLVVLAQVAASVLDLVGVLLIGLVGLLLAANLSGTEVPTAITAGLSRLGLVDVSLTSLTIWCSVLAAAFLLTKSLVSALLMRRIFRFLGHRQAQVSEALTARVLSSPLLAVESRSSQETVYSVYTAVVASITSTLGSFAIVLGEAALLLMLGSALLIINPPVAVAALLFFGGVGLVIHRALGSWAWRIGGRIASTAVQGMQRLQEAITAYREITVLGRRDQYVRIISAHWVKGGVAQADALFVLQLPKIGYEAALVIGAALLAAWQFGTQPPAQALGMLALFVGAATRIFPSMLRINSLVLTIRAGAGQSESLHRFVDELESIPLIGAVSQVGSDATSIRAPSTDADVSLTSVCFTYPGSREPALTDITLWIPSGTSLALVGPTGSGKSTLVDILLGLLTPEKGEARIAGVPSEAFIALSPGTVAYVPQSVAIVDGSIRANVALGIPPSKVDDAMVWMALGKAHLADLVDSRPKALDELVGERGVRLSGGQRQRLGIARALYSNPQVLVMDEATSALDAETERLITDTIAAVPRGTTTVVVAHRLATIQHCDQICVLNQGEVAALGSFDQVRQLSPAFDRQARLLGL